MIANIIADSQSSLEHLYSQVLSVFTQVEEYSIWWASGEPDGNIDGGSDRRGCQLYKATWIYEVYRCQVLAVFTWVHKNN